MSIDFRDDLRADIQPSYTDSLMHHGIKGMHWGVRRPRNEDGIIEGAGAKLAAEQKKQQRLANKHNRDADYANKWATRIQKDADDHGAKARATRNIFKKAGHRVAQAWDANAAAVWRDNEQFYRKRAAGAQWRADTTAAAKELHDWGERANRGYAKNHDDARMARSAEKAVSKYKAASEEAEKRYKRTVNARAIDAANKKAKLFEKKANFHNSMDRGLDKHSRELGLPGQIIATPARGTARAYGAYYNLRSKMARNRARRLSGE